MILTVRPTGGVAWGVCSKVSCRPMDGASNVLSSRAAYNVSQRPVARPAYVLGRVFRAAYNAARTPL
eukprot:366452-Chlamydomonas_euryale.AAC.1